jgi:hypothetical protein
MVTNTFSINKKSKKIKINLLQESTNFTYNLKTCGLSLKNNNSSPHKHAGEELFSISLIGWFE